jgi:hypothetical protein
MLAEGDPIPPVERQDAVRAHLAVLDPAVDPLAGARRGVPVPAAPVDANHEAVAATRGRGGLPILATALIGDVSRPERRMADNGKPASNDPTAVSSINGATKPCHATSSDSASRQDSSERSASRRRGRRASILPGVTAALTLAVGLVLPDLVAAFHFQSPRRVRFTLGRRLRWLRVYF